MPTHAAERAVSDRPASPVGVAHRWLPWLSMLLVAAGLLLLLWSPWQAAGAAGSAPAPVTAPTGGAPAASGPIAPVRLVIPAIGVDAPVEARGTVRTRNPFTGRVVDGFGVPASMRTTAWWSDGPKPGSGQMAVVLGHLQVGGYGVFDHLDRLRPGDAVDLYDRGGSVLRLQVLAAPVTGLAKSTSALADVLNGHPAGAAVALVTCGGRFDRAVGQSVDNTVVFARAVGR